MPTYWDSFIERYKDSIPYKSIGVILQAFWFFCNDNNQDNSDELMKLL